jgi:hypothetical protein
MIKAQFAFALAHCDLMQPGTIFSGLFAINATQIIDIPREAPSYSM